MAPVLSAATVTAYALSATVVSGALSAFGGNISRTIDYLRALGKKECPLCCEWVKKNEYKQHIRSCKEEMADINREERDEEAERLAVAVAAARILDMMVAKCPFCQATMNQRDLEQHVKQHAVEHEAQRARMENIIRSKDCKGRKRGSKNKR